MRKRIHLSAALAAVLSLATSCHAEGEGKTATGKNLPAPDPRFVAVKAALAESVFDPDTRASIVSRVEASPERFFSLLSAAEKASAADSGLLARVDKVMHLSSEYVPPDIVSLDGSSVPVSRAGHSLRRSALEALVEMEAAARKDGVSLLVGSAYRSFAYQKGVFDRSVAADGLEETERSIALPGASQHQLGTALDFAPIDDAFAETKASSWLEANAVRFGFSLSFPKGMEAITGYKWESWHYRYLGKAAAALVDGYFGGIQHYLLAFLEKY